MKTQVRLLGPLEVENSRGPVKVAGPKRRALVSYLVVNRAVPSPVDRIVDALWDGDPSAGAEATVRTYVSQLRHVFAEEGPALLARPGGYQLDIDPACIDVARFEEAIAAALAETSTPVRLGLVDEALSVWRGPPLDEFSGQAWADDAARHWTRLRMLAVEKRVDALLEMDRATDALLLAETTVSEFPLHEPLWIALMLARYRCGRQVDALRAAREARQVLATELGIEPGPELAAMEQRVLAQDPALLVRAPAGPDVSPRHHTQRSQRPRYDNARSRGLLQTTTTTATALRATSRQTVPTPQLAPPRSTSPSLSRRLETSFVGRVDELSRLDRLLHSARLVSVVGPGGIGKTRLTLEAAQGAASRFTNTIVVELADIVEQELPDAVARACGYLGGGDHPFEPFEHILGRDRTLLILDNCEHLLDACAEIASNLLQQSPQLSIVATSRAPLDIAGEALLRLEPLAQDDAVALFCARASVVQPDFQHNRDNADAIGRICRRVDGIPLAVELAAARLRAMTAFDLLRTMDVLELVGPRSSAARHRTMRHALEWSYDLLSQPAQALFPRLGVFADFDMISADAVCADGTKDVPLAVLLEELVAASLVVFESGGGRYRLLEPLRQYALELLDGLGQVERWRKRHAHHFLERAPQVARTFSAVSFEQTPLDMDVHNLELALAWAADGGDDALFLKTVGALGFFWFSTASDQGIRWTERAVAGMDGAPLSVRAAVLLAAGQTHQTRPEPDERCDAWLGEAATIFEALGRHGNAAWCQYWLGSHLEHLDPVRARSCLEQALATFRRLDHKLGTAWGLLTLAGIADDRGDLEKAAALFSDVVQLRDDVPSVTGNALVELAVVRVRTGDISGGLELAHEAVELSASVGGRWNRTLILAAAAWVELAADNHRAAAGHLEQALRLGQEIGSRDRLAQLLILVAHLRLAAGEAAQARAVMSAAGWGDLEPTTRTVAHLSFLHVRAALAVLDVEDTTRRDESLSFDEAVEQSLAWLAAQQNR